MKKTIFLFLLPALLWSCKNEQTPLSEDVTYTDIIVKNSSELDSVQVFLTLQSTDSVIGMFGITGYSTAQCKGSFWAKKGVEYHSGRITPILGGVLTFGADNYACDAAREKGIYLGVNCFEFSININAESADITCLDGLNAILKYSVSDTVNWKAGAYSFSSTQNKFPLEDNCNIKGVFPYQCDVCDRSVRPPKPDCFGHIKCSSRKDCQINRTGHIGGTITVEYISGIPQPCK